MNIVIDVGYLLFDDQVFGLLAIHATHGWSGTFLETWETSCHHSEKSKVCFCLFCCGFVWRDLLFA